MSMIDKFAVIQENRTRIDEGKDIPLFQELIEVDGINFWEKCEDVMTGNRFIMPVLESMKGQIVQNERNLQHKTLSHMFRIPASISLENLIINDTSRYNRDEIHNNRSIPNLPADLNNNEKVYFLTFENFDLADTFLREVDFTKKSVAKVTPPTEYHRNSVGALYEVNEWPNNKIGTENAWVIELNR